MGNKPGEGNHEVIHAKTSTRQNIHGKYWLILLLFALCLFPNSSSAQQPIKCHKRVGYFTSLNPHRLSKKLTRHCVSDTEKVKAIHSWITHNIKYDVKSWITYSPTPPKVKRILRRRKAICSGYSALFNELCGHANIWSVTVPGYSKNIDVDVGDKVYAEDHAWNAVYVNERWSLADLCWDAGGIKYFRPTIKGWISYIISLGKKSKLRYKPKFVRNPSNNYLMRSGNIFITDHLPLNPIWQLLAPLDSVQQFEKDSSYYYKHYETIDDFYGVDGLAYDRNKYYASDQNNKIIMDGTDGHAFNHKNHICIANGNSVFTSLKMQEFMNSLNNYETQLKASNLAIVTAQRNLIHLDSALYFLHVEKKDLLLNNEKKKAIFEEINLPLINASKEIHRSLLRAEKIAGKTKRKLIQKQKSYNRRAKVKNNSFLAVKWAYSTKEPDSVNVSCMIDYVDNHIRHKNYNWNKPIRVWIPVSRSF